MACEKAPSIIHKVHAEQVPVDANTTRVNARVQEALEDWMLMVTTYSNESSLGSGTEQNDTARSIPHIT